MKKIFGTLVSILLIAAVFTSCQKKDSRKTLRVSYFPGATYDPLVELASEKGWFKEEGINVEILSFSNGPAANEAIVSGDLDVVYAVGDQPFVTQVARGVDAIIISAATRQSTNVGIQARDGINTVYDLKGKKIAVGIGTMNHKNLLAILNDFDITDSQLEIVNGSGTEAFNSLQNGSLDAVYYSTAWDGIQAEKAGGHKIIDGNGHEANTFTYTTRKFAEENPDLIISFLKVLYRAEKYIQTNSDDAYKTIADFLGVDVEKIRINNTGNVWATGIQDDVVPHITETYDFLYQRDYIKNEIKDFSPYVEAKYVNKAYELFKKGNY